MSVQFSAGVDPDGWVTACAWDTNVYPTYEAANAAANSHPAGGCSEGRTFFGQMKYFSDSEKWEAESLLRDLTGKWASACVDGALWCEPHYSEQMPVLQLSNGNAIPLMRALGLTSGHDIVAEAQCGADDVASVIAQMCPSDIEWCGSITPDGLKSRIIVARALMSDDGRPAFSQEFGNGSAVTDCGVDAGYYARKLEILSEVADAAERHGAKVVWS